MRRQQKLRQRQRWQAPTVTTTTREMAASTITGATITEAVTTPEATTAANTAGGSAATRFLLQSQTDRRDGKS